MMSITKVKLSTVAGSPSFPISSPLNNSPKRSTRLCLDMVAESSPGRKISSPLRQKETSNMSTKQICSAEGKLDCRDLVMEKVKILKRGEEMPSSSTTLSSGNSMESPKPCLTAHLRPDPRSLSKPIFPAYAGPVFISSPPPNSLPVPIFAKKAASRGEDVATRTLMCLLRLDISL